MKHIIILTLSLLFTFCGTDKVQHQTLFGTEYFGSGDSLTIQIKAENGILTGQSFRKNKNLICDLKGNVETDGGITFSEFNQLQLYHQARYLKRRRLICLRNS